jgi:hypothetical protein
MGIVDRIVRRVVPKTRKGKLRVVVYGLPVVLLGLDMGLVRWWRRVPVGVETTRVTVVNGEGYPDYLGWTNDKYGAGVTRENNAAVGLLEAVGYAGDPALLRAMGMREEKPAGVLRKSFWDYMDARLGGNGGGTDLRARFRAEERASRMAPWRASEHPLWAGWIESNEAALAMFHEAMKKDRYFVPAVGRGGILRGGGPGVFADMDNGGAYMVSAYRVVLVLSRAALARAAMRAGSGDWEGYRSDITDVLHLVRLLAGSWRSMDVTRACLLQELAAQGLTESVGKMPASAAEALLKAVGELDFKEESARVLDEEWRFGDLDSVQWIAREGFQGWRLARLENEVAFVSAPRLAPAVRILWPVDYAGYARAVNEWYDRAASDLRAGRPPRSEEPWGSSAPGWHWWLWPRRAMRIDLNLVQGNNLPTLAELHVPLARGGLALQVFRERHGAYPERLEELVPEELGAIPLDIVTHVPLKYRREGKGFVLYSVGQDRVDNGGRQRELNEASGDEVVRVVER